MYTKAEAISILALQPPLVFSKAANQSLGEELDPETQAIEAEDAAWVWQRFTSAVYDSFARSSARDIVSFRTVCDKLWKPFVAPIIAGEYGTRDFSKMMVAQRALFQSEGVLLAGTVLDAQSTSANGGKLYSDSKYNTSFLPLLRIVYFCFPFTAPPLTTTLPRKKHPHKSRSSLLHETPHLCRVPRILQSGEARHATLLNNIRA
jgi:hypothetical protein